MRNDTLTRREAEVLALLAQGLYHKEVAARLGMATSTAKAHIRSIYEKLNVHSKKEAIAWYQKEVGHAQNRNGH